MKKIKIPVPAIIIAGLIGLAFGIIFVYVSSGTIYPRDLLIFLVPAVLAGAVLELIFWYYRRQNAPLVKVFENLPLEIVHLLKLVIKSMRYRRSVRYDVMNELAAHFEDELRGCKDEKEKEQKAKKLIEQFGDPQLLGILLRRAKKRCRPLWRTAVVRAFQTAGVLIICLVAYILWFLSGKPVITTDYVAELNRIVRTVVDESQNAAPFYEKAIHLLNANKDYDDIRVVEYKEYDEITDNEKDNINKWINTNKNILSLIIEGSQKSYYWFTYQIEPNAGISNLPNIMPDLFEYQKLGRLLAYQAQYHAENIHVKDSLNELLAIYRIGYHLKQGNAPLIQQFFGASIEISSASLIRKILWTNKIESSLLKEVQQRLENAIKDENAGINFEGEKLIVYDRIQRMFTKGNLGSHIYFPSILDKDDELYSLGILFSFIASPKMTMHILFSHPGEEETRKEADKMFEYFKNVSLKSPAQLNKEGIDLNIKNETANLLVDLSRPMFAMAINSYHARKTDIQGAIAVIALQRYKQDKGGYPDSLQELVKGDYLMELPIDPWSDKPLVYRKTDNDFILYSIGPNFKDDGGVVARDGEGRIRIWDRNEGDVVFWPAGK